MKKHERIAGLVTIAFGLATGIHAWMNLKLGSLQRPDSGFLPFIASAVMVICAVVWILNNLGADENPKPFWVARGWYRPLMAFVLLLLYAIAMEPMGYLLSTLLFMLAWQWLVERANWKKVTIVSVTSTVVMWLLFGQLLGVPLPSGFLTL